MKLLFKQRFFSWFDSFDIYDENGNVIFVVKGQLAWGHMFNIYDNRGKKVGFLQEKIFTFLHTFEFETDNARGKIQKEITFFKPSIKVDSSPNYQVEGNLLGWNYIIYRNGVKCGEINKKILNFTDTYILDCNNDDALIGILILLAIDAIKCDHNNGRR